LPKLDTTPPVTKTYFADIGATSLFDCWDWSELMDTINYDRDRCEKKAEISPAQINSHKAVDNQLGFIALRRNNSLKNPPHLPLNPLIRVPLAQRRQQS